MIPYFYGYQGEVFPLFRMTFIQVMYSTCKAKQKQIYPRPITFFLCETIKDGSQLEIALKVELYLQAQIQGVRDVRAYRRNDSLGWIAV